MAIERMNACYWPPEQVKQRDAVIYERIRDRVVRAHCADDRKSHKCAGRITMDRNSMILQCRRCGDLKLNTSVGEPED